MTGRIESGTQERGEYDAGHLRCAFNEDSFGTSSAEWYHDPDKRHPPVSPVAPFPEGSLKDELLVPDGNWRFEQADKTNAELEICFEFTLDAKVIAGPTALLRRRLDSEEHHRWRATRIFLAGIRADGKDSGWRVDIDIRAFLHQGMNIAFVYDFGSKDRQDSVHEDFLIPYKVSTTGTMNRLSYKVVWRKVAGR